MAKKKRHCRLVFVCASLLFLKNKNSDIEFIYMARLLLNLNTLSHETFTMHYFTQFCVCVEIMRIYERPRNIHDLREIQFRIYIMCD